MKRLVSVSASYFSTKNPSICHIYNYDEYNIDCSIESQDLENFKDKYLLLLDGSAENIQMFLEYLKYNGFKIK